jgi:hypothetical protein
MKKIIFFAIIFLAILGGTIVVADNNAVQVPKKADIVFSAEPETPAASEKKSDWWHNPFILLGGTLGLIVLFGMLMLYSIEHSDYDDNDDDSCYSHNDTAEEQYKEW